MEKTYHFPVTEIKKSHNREALRKGIRMLTAGMLAAAMLIFAEKSVIAPSVTEKTNSGTDAALEEVREIRLTNHEETISSIRAALRGRAASITVRFEETRNVLPLLQEASAEWMEEALAETDSPEEGDYLRYLYGGYTCSARYEETGGLYRYAVKIVPDYYTFLAQEEAVSEKVREIIAGFAFDEATTDMEKITVCYDYLCSTTSYDKVRGKNPYNHKCATAYAALIQKSATCQGFCTALYRLLRTAGVSCRIVTGAAGEDSLHAWMIAAVDGLYYQLDPTWDAGRTDEEWQYFLRGTEDFPEHVPGERFTADDFLTAYPMAAHAFAGT